MSGRLKFWPAERAEHRDSSRCEATLEEDVRLVVTSQTLGISAPFGLRLDLSVCRDKRE